MPVTLRVAFTIFSVVTISTSIPLLWVALFLGAWGWGGGKLFGLIPIALFAAYAAVTILLMIRRGWARYAAVVFPLSFAAAAVVMHEWREAVPVLVVAMVLTLSALGLTFAPRSRDYFTRASRT
ncbi:hypothetical protein ACNPNP_13980 [Microbacterium sp. AGC85]